MTNINAQDRVDSISRLDASTDEAQGILRDIVKNDDDVDVRVAAISKLDNLDTLRELLDSDDGQSNEIAHAVEDRLMTKIEKGIVNDLAVRDLLDSHASLLAVSIATRSPVVEQREMALNAIEDEPSLVAVVQRARFHTTRFAAAERLSGHGALRAAFAVVRSRDRVVARKLQERLHAYSLEMQKKLDADEMEGKRQHRMEIINSEHEQYRSEIRGRVIEQIEIIGRDLVISQLDLQLKKQAKEITLGLHELNKTIAESYTEKEFANVSTLTISEFAGSDVESDIYDGLKQAAALFPH